MKQSDVQNIMLRELLNVYTEHANVKQILYKLLDEAKGCTEYSAT